MNRARLLAAAVTASIVLFAPAAAHAATPSPQVQAQVAAQRGTIAGYDAAIKSIQAQMSANQQQIAIFQLQMQAALARPLGSGEAMSFHVQIVQAQDRNRQLAGVLGALYNQRAVAQAKLAQLLATP
jgi:hypothetical protein